MSKAKLGKAPWNKGLKGHPSCKGFTKNHSDETKAKISENRKGKCLGNTHGFKKGQPTWNKGKPHKVHDEQWRKQVSEANSGKNHWNWKGGISGPNALMRNSTKHKNWSKAVYRKDNWTCQKCSANNHHILIAHHIVPWKDNAFLRFKVSNGVTLCRSCHIKLHKPRKSPKVHC